jgi:RHS repeat-associated protein
MNRIQTRIKTAQIQSCHTFSAKEKDDETGYSYFGARYYDSDLSVWLSVDPMAHKFPSMSSYMYCAGNPVMLVDPDGRVIKPSNEEGVQLVDAAIGRYKNNKGEDIFGSSKINAIDGNIRYEVKKEYKLEDFQRNAQEAGLKLGTEEYKEAEALFDALQSDKEYEVAIIDLSTLNSENKIYSTRTKNSSLNDFLENHKTDETTGKGNYPSQTEIDEFLKKGDNNGVGFGFFKNKNEKILKGILLINPIQKAELESSYNNSQYNNTEIVKQFYKGIYESTKK